MTCRHNTHVTVDNNIVSWREILGDPATNPKLLKLIDKKLEGLQGVIDTDLQDKLDEMLAEILAKVKDELKVAKEEIDPYKIKWNDTTVGDALDKLFNLELSGTITEDAVAELGKRYNEYVVAWKFSKPLVKLTIQKLDAGEIVDEKELDPETTKYTYENITNSTQFVIIGKTEDETCKLAHKIDFKLRWYYGVLSDTNPTNASLINLASTYVDEHTVFGKHTFNCEGGKYIYYLFPENLHKSYDFITNGLNDNTWVYETKAVTNSYGYLNNYIVYRNTNLLHGKNIHSEVHVDDWY